jgi:hypothetical protein
MCSDEQIKMNDSRMRRGGSTEPVCTTAHDASTFPINDNLKALYGPLLAALSDLDRELQQDADKKSCDSSFPHASDTTTSASPKASDYDKRRIIRNHSKREPVIFTGRSATAKCDERVRDVTNESAPARSNTTQSRLATSFKARRSTEMSSPRFAYSYGAPARPFAHKSHRPNFERRGSSQRRTHDSTMGSRFRDSNVGMETREKGRKKELLLSTESAVRGTRDQSSKVAAAA